MESKWTVQCWPDGTDKGTEDKQGWPHSISASKYFLSSYLSEKQIFRVNRNVRQGFKVGQDAFKPNTGGKI